MKGYIIMKKVFKTLSLVLSFLLVFEAFSFIAYAENPTEYVEEHIQFNLEEYNIYIENKDKLIIETDKNANIIKQYKQKKNIKYLETYFEEYPSIEKEIIDAINNNEHISIFGYTEAEFVADKDGDMIRVKNEKSLKNNSIIGYSVLASNVSTGQTQDKYYFSFATMVTRSGTKNPYTYTGVSMGAWSKNSVLGGAQYPASGLDCIAQIAPDSFTVTKSSIAIDYNHGKTPVSGTDYSLIKGGNNYLCYDVADDPSGNNQMEDVSLTINYSANSSTAARLIGSYYVHTWAAVTFAINLGATVNKDGAVGIGLNITPSNQEKTWQLYSYVTFKF